MIVRRGIYWGLLVAVFVAQGCAINPLHNDWVDDRDTSISLNAFTVVKSSPVKVQCRPYLVGGSWTTIKSFVGSSSPTLDDASRGGKLYSATTRFVVPEACWYHWHSQYTTELRFMGGPYTDTGSESALAVFDDAGIQCLSNKWGSGGTYVEIYNECRKKYASGNAVQSIYVNAHED